MAFQDINNYLLAGKTEILLQGAYLETNDENHKVHGTYTLRQIHDFVTG